MNFILYAVPFFFVLIAVELLADCWRKVNYYRVADAINSSSTGVLSTTTGLLTKGKFDVPLNLAQQIYIDVQFSLHTLLGSYLLSNGEALSSPALMLGWTWVALGLFVFGVALENRPAALKLEGVRLVANWPLMALAPVVGLWSASSLGWAALLTYTLLSTIAMYRAHGRFIRLAGPWRRPQQAAPAWLLPGQCGRS